MGCMTIKDFVDGIQNVMKSNCVDPSMEAIMDIWMVTEGSSEASKYPVGTVLMRCRETQAKVDYEDGDSILWVMPKKITNLQ